MRTITVSALLYALAILPLTREPAQAQTSPTHAANALLSCSYPISATTDAVWRDLGAETGRLGCAVQPERPGPKSPQGSASSLALFDSGEIVTHTGGPRMGQAFAVVGCFYRLHVQFGGASGWLGLPVASSQNTPDGAGQSFEGGDMRYTRAYDDCQATPGASSPAAPPVAAAIAEAIPLDLYEDPATGNRLSLASQRSVEIALAAGYRRLRPQARVLATSQNDDTPLKLYLNEARGLRRTLASIQSERDALADGFAFEASQGFIWTAPHQGSIALKLYRNMVTGAARLTAGPVDEADAGTAGQTFVRVEGYAVPPS